MGSLLKGSRAGVQNKTVLSKDDVKTEQYYKVKSLLSSFKFFFIQINDICELTTVLGIIFVLRELKIGFFGEISQSDFNTYA